jgi:RecB family exonuclease
MRNEHLSVSRIRRYAQCPKAYKLHYLEKKEAQPGAPLAFGKVQHAALERTYRQIVTDRITGRFPLELLVAAYKYEWGRAGLSDFAEFEDGLKLLKDYAANHSDVDYAIVLAIEQEFRLPVDRFEVLGYVDRVDRVDNDTVEIIDYKSNRLLFSREEVDSDLQLSIYALAVRALWPWVKNIKLSFYMLRHAVRVETSRTPEQLAAARDYVAALGHQMETATDFPARLNANCSYCDHRSDCDAYERALRYEVDSTVADERNLEQVARARQELAHTIKILSARKDQLDGIIKAHLKEHDALVVGGVRFSMWNINKLTYPLRRTIDLVSSATGIPKTEVADQIAIVDKSALDALMKAASKRIPRERADLLEVELEAIADKTTSQRLWAKEVANATH